MVDDGSVRVPDDESRSVTVGDDGTCVKCIFAYRGVHTFICIETYAYLNIERLYPS